jgi:hypothetical protein
MNRKSAKRSPQKELLNCWEVMMCGREESGKNAAQYGVCPASADRSFDGINSGKRGAESVGRLQGRFVTGAYRDRLQITD